MKTKSALLTPTGRPMTLRIPKSHLAAVAELASQARPFNRESKAWRFLARTRTNDASIYQLIRRYRVLNATAANGHSNGLMTVVHAQPVPAVVCQCETCRGLRALEGALLVFKSVQAGLRLGGGR